jgi:hypothetical protein
MRAWLLSLIIPRHVLQTALYEQWRRSLPRDQRIRLDYWGTAGPDLGHHPFQWADEINAPSKEGCQNESLSMTTA